MFVVPKAQTETLQDVSATYPVQGTQSLSQPGDHKVKL